MLLLLPVVTVVAMEVVPSEDKMCFALLKSFRVLKGHLELLSAALMWILHDDSHHFFLVVGSGVFSASSEADDSDNLHGRSFSRSHHLWWPVRQVVLSALKAVSWCFSSTFILPHHTVPCVFSRFGRRSVLIWSNLQLAILGCSSALSPSYSVYCILRFFCGMAVSGIIINGVSLSKHPLFFCL